MPKVHRKVKPKIRTAEEVTQVRDGCKFFTGFSTEDFGDKEDDTHYVSRSFNREEFATYFEALTDAERKSLHAKARWEQITLSAAAMDYGAVIEVDEQRK